MAKRKRDIQLKFRVTPQEREMIETKMAQFGTTNMAAYLRKMAIDGYVVKLDLPELRELVSLLRYSSNNLNQLTRRAHETGRIYETDGEHIHKNQHVIWRAGDKMVAARAALKYGAGGGFMPPPLSVQKQKPRRKTASELLRFQIIFIE